jgi:hypothetical protein
MPSGNIKDKFKSEMLVLMMERINKTSRSDGLGWHDMQTKFHEDSYTPSGNIKDLLQ